MKIIPFTPAWLLVFSKETPYRCPQILRLFHDQASHLLLCDPVMFSRIIPHFLFFPQIPPVLHLLFLYLSFLILSGFFSLILLIENLCHNLIQAVIFFHRLSMQKKDRLYTFLILIICMFDKILRQFMQVFP